MFQLSFGARSSELRSAEPNLGKRSQELHEDLTTGLDRVAVRQAIRGEQRSDLRGRAICNVPIINGEPNLVRGIAITARKQFALESTGPTVLRLTRRIMQHRTCETKLNHN